MTTPDPTEQLLHAMLERRAEAPVPGWLLSGVSGAVHATGQVAPQGRGGGLAGSRRNRLLLVAAAALLLLSMTAGALLASGVLRLIERPSLHALVTESPSPSPEASVDVTPAPSSAAPDPSPAPARSPAPPAVVAFRPWPMPAGLRYEVGCDEDSGRCFLHLYDEAGGEPKGWPVRLRGDCSSDVAVGPDAAAFVACARNGQAVITGLDLTGSPLPGWPVDVPGQVGYVTWNAFQRYGGAASIAVGPDATVYAAVAPRGRDPGLALHAFAPNGTPRKGWPRHLPGRAQGFAVASDGAVVAWWYEGALEDMELSARRTVFTTIAADGRTLPGWPIGSKGAASGPLLWDDGSITYVSASGKVWEHDRKGAVARGWPVQLATPLAPERGPDGTLVFIGEDRVIALDRHGDAVKGWPYRVRGSLSAPGCDTGGYSELLYVRGADGTLYLAPFDGKRSSIVALDSHGRVVAGWPFRVPVGWRVARLAQRPDGSLTADLLSEICSGWDLTTINLTMAGALVGDPPGTPLPVVYKSLRLEGLRTATGSTAFAQGARIDLEFQLVNRGRSAIVPPLVTHDVRTAYVAGSILTWIERLGGERTIKCLDPMDPDEDVIVYPTGGGIIASDTRITIPPGAAVSGTTGATLAPEVTGCLPPGEYRFHVDYLSVSGDDGVARSAQGIKLTIGDPAGDPASSPRPSGG